MARSTLLSLACAASISSLVAMSAGAAEYQFMDINFTGDTLGTAPITGVQPPSPGNPIGQLGGIGGYTATAQNVPPTADNGTVVVGNVAGMSNAVVMTTSPDNAVLGALYLDTGFSIPGQKATISFDISVLAAPTTATVQPKLLNNTTETAGILLGMNIFGSATGPRFAVAPTSETGGVFAMRSADNTRLFTFFDYTEGDAYNVKLTFDYSTGMVDAFVNDVLQLSGHPFAASGAGSVTTSEVFFHLNGESYASSVALDNISASVTVPEPASLAMLGLAAGALFIRRRR